MIGASMREYREPDADNTRWNDFEFRPGDIIVAAPSKSGTTWTQLLVALLVFDGPDFPMPVGRMSLWLEQATRPAAEAHATFAAQNHRRFIKSHTPLDGIPMRDDIRYVCVGRDPRDAALSMLHHGENLDRDRLAELIGVDPSVVARSTELTDEDRIDLFIDGEDFPGWNVRFLLHHYSTFWAQRERPNVALFHFDDYLRDLPAELARLAHHLGIAVPRDRAEALAAEAAIDRVRDRAADVAPEAHMGLFKNVSGFFRSGTSGEWRERWTPAQIERYLDLVSATVPDDLAEWIHGGRGGGSAPSISGR